MKNINITHYITWLLLFAGIFFILRGSNEMKHYQEYNQAKLDSIQAGQDKADTARAVIQPLVIELNQKHDEKQNEFKERTMDFVDSLIHNFHAFPSAEDMRRR